MKKKFKRGGGRRRQKGKIRNLGGNGTTHRVSGLMTRIRRKKGGSAQVQKEKAGADEE